MAKFTGTHEEFRRYIGPCLRNLVQQITRSYRDAIGSCEHCGATDKLESAHIRGRDRNQIIDLVLAPYIADGLVEVELVSFEKAFKAEHNPLEKSILILCRDCHRKYDAKKQSVKNGMTLSADSANKNDLLPITLDPSTSENFKKELLISKTAEIVIYYSDGRIEEKLWKASQFSASSNVMGNLRSRQEFRSGKWQSHGIVKIHVKVIKNA